MMNRNEIMEAIVRSAIVPRYVNKFYHGSYREDVVSDLYFIIHAILNIVYCSK